MCNMVDLTAPSTDREGYCNHLELHFSRRWLSWDISFHDAILSPLCCIGTLISAFTVLCGAHSELIPERGVCCVFWLNVAAALIQILTAVIMVGWIMSIFWGMDMVILASQFLFIVFTACILLHCFPNFCGSPNVIFHKHSTHLRQCCSDFKAVYSYRISSSAGTEKEQPKSGCVFSYVPVYTCVLGCISKCFQLNFCEYHVSNESITAPLFFSLLSPLSSHLHASVSDGRFLS